MRNEACSAPAKPEVPSIVRKLRNLPPDQIPRRCEPLPQRVELRRREGSPIEPQPGPDADRPEAIEDRSVPRQRRIVHEDRVEHIEEGQRLAAVELQLRSRRRLLALDSRIEERNRKLVLQRMDLRQIVGPVGQDAEQGPDHVTRSADESGAMGRGAVPGRGHEQDARRRVRRPRSQHGEIVAEHIHQGEAVVAVGGRRQANQDRSPGEVDPGARFQHVRVGVGDAPGRRRRQPASMLQGVEPHRRAVLRAAESPQPQPRHLIGRETVQIGEPGPVHQVGRDLGRRSVRLEHRRLIHGAPPAPRRVRLRPCLHHRLQSKSLARRKK